MAYEVVQEAILMPLYFVFGQVIHNLSELRKRVSIAIIVTLVAYGLLTLGILFGADWLTQAMSQQQALQDMTARYIRLETIGKMIGVLNDIAIIIVVALAWKRILIALVILRALLMITFDSLFVGQFDFSLHLGVQGVAMTNISVATCLLLPTVFILLRAEMFERPRLRKPSAWMRRWLRIAARSGIESAVRNLAFSLMILRLMNEVNEAGLFWVTNSFIWGWLLLPVLALGTLIRQDAGNNGGKLEGRFTGYLWLIAIIVGVWIVTIPGWLWFFKNALGTDEPERILSLTLLMLGFYVVFAFNHVLDSFFYGRGRTDLLLYQSLFVSIFYYGIAFVAYQTGFFAPGLQSIALLFGGGILVDSALTLWQFKNAGYFNVASEKSPQKSGGF
ncbi:hypothetical protein RC74_17620 [Falsihalocynthiibacter arcticus]|uniref:Multidrug transporter n=1 Tax=Falsihalocynthiibacter arcticus TaxID=1579316 RepID=A0A126V3E1_9RHOB|nr:hypothetical protein RC74_17620 [Falsihalocynthiibacter arcticus]